MGLLGSCCGKTDPSKTDTSMPGIELEKASATPHFQWAARNGPGAPRGPIVPKGPIVLVDEGTHAMQGAWWPGLWGQPEESGGSEDAARTPCQWRNRARAHKTRSDCASAHATHRHHHDEQDPQPKRPHAAGGASPAGEPTSVRHSQPPRAFGWCNLISGALAATGSALSWPNSGDFNSPQRRAPTGPKGSRRRWRSRTANKTQSQATNERNPEGSRAAVHVRAQYPEYPVSAPSIANGRSPRVPQSRAQTAPPPRKQSATGTAQRQRGSPCCPCCAP